MGMWVGWGTRKDFLLEGGGGGGRCAGKTKHPSSLPPLQRDYEAACLSVPPTPIKEKYRKTLNFEIKTFVLKSCKQLIFLPHSFSFRSASLTKMCAYVCSLA